MSVKREGFGPKMEAWLQRYGESLVENWDASIEEFGTDLVIVLDTPRMMVVCFRRTEWLQLPWVKELIEFDPTIGERLKVAASDWDPKRLPTECAWLFIRGPEVENGAFFCRFHRPIELDEPIGSA